MGPEAVCPSIPLGLVRPDALEDSGVVSPASFEGGVLCR